MIRNSTIAMILRRFFNLKDLVMRELKFRGLRVDDNTFISGYGVCIVPNEDLATIIGFHGNNLMQSTEVIPESVGQFTGLKDKNGVDIYEGDILEYKNELGRHHLAKIFYKKGGLCFNIHKDDFYKKPKEIHFYESCADMQSKGFIVQFKIIGNIHENKDLV
jgi:uncharacterized phage protein (TIGR01671 family)